MWTKPIVGATLFDHWMPDSGIAGPVIAATGSQGDLVLLADESRGELHQVFTLTSQRASLSLELASYLPDATTSQPHRLDAHIQVGGSDSLLGVDGRSVRSAA